MNNVGDQGLEIPWMKNVRVPWDTEENSYTQR